MNELVPLLSGALGALVGVLVARHLPIRARQRLDTFVSPGAAHRRRKVMRRARQGVAGIPDVGEYLRTSIKGMRFFTDHSTPLVDYLSWWSRTEDPDISLAATPEESQAACAVLIWLHHDPDWDLLLACMNARLRIAVASWPFGRIQSFTIRRFDGRGGMPSSCSIVIVTTTVALTPAVCGVASTG